MARPTSDDRLSLTAAPMSCASGRRGVCILRAPGGPVDLDRHPAGGGPRFDQFERTVPAGVREQPRALADDHGIREQGDLVDQLLVDEPADKLAAAVHLQLTRRLGFQLADGRRTVTGEDGRLRPARFGERGRGHVLGLRVQRRPDRAVTRIWPHSPGAGEDLVGPPAEQERVGALEDPVEERIGLVDEQRRGPSAALESAPAVLVRPADSLHNSIDGNVRDGRQFHGFVLSLVVASLPFFDRFGLVYAARLQQQGRRFPLFIFEILTSTRRLRVSGFWVALTHRTHSQRAIGVISFHRSWIFCGAAARAVLRSGSTLGSGQSLTDSSSSVALSPALKAVLSCSFRSILIQWPKLPSGSNTVWN